LFEKSTHAIILFGFLKIIEPINTAIFIGDKTIEVDSEVKNNFSHKVKLEDLKTATREPWNCDGGSAWSFSPRPDSYRGKSWTKVQNSQTDQLLELLLSNKKSFSLPLSFIIFNY